MLYSSSCNLILRKFIILLREINVLNNIKLIEVDKVEILSLIDNYIDMVSQDNNDIIKRATMLKEGHLNNSIYAEHGFSAIVTTEANNHSHSMLFDFGFSSEGAAFNAEALGIKLSEVEEMALSHGHSDHMGSVKNLLRLIGKNGIRLVVHPQAFVPRRYLKYGENFKVDFVKLSKEEFEELGVKVEVSSKPLSLLNGSAIFLGEIPRVTDFEKVMPNAYYEENGVEKTDPILDDTALVMNLRGKGLIILTGCAHAGIINTVYHACKVTGENKVHVIMGGFHLTGTYFEPIIGRVIEAFRQINPNYIVPTHCSGRKAMNAIEKEFPGKFLLNMSGTKLTFA
jgi:7,8-dihydropterin-6-yl-methyl-4-(beta-D-ribofuranosyl)aminobenzene 5'-phosphate synthase